MQQLRIKNAHLMLYEYKFDTYIVCRFMNGLHQTLVFCTVVLLNFSPNLAFRLSKNLNKAKKGSVIRFSY